ncbi:MAG TPA: glucan 1,4-alpha-glucosidase [Pyrinomonadaceae bacterium]|nr:glucan 1,4-alpha-glucosidase [Pyrinomonadaceae bacterium]
MPRLLSILVWLVFPSGALFAQTTNQQAPGAPGIDAHWPTAAKNGFGTANTTASRIWFTLAGGVLTEVFYPTLDMPNVQQLQFIVVSENGVETESEHMDHRLEVLNPRALSFRQVNTSRNGDYTISKNYTVDPARATLLIKVTFSSRNSISCRLYLYYDPSLNNSGRHDTAWSDRRVLFAVDGDKASALVASTGLEDATNGFLGINDGLTQLKQSGEIVNQYPKAMAGNVVQVARIREPRAFTIALSFGKSAGEALGLAQSSLAAGFVDVQRDYESGWDSYLGSLEQVEPKYQEQFNMAAMVLKALEDKTYRGAMSASPSTPWGGGPNANEATVSGYHAVWPRDLYQVATAFLAMGDRASANRALDYLFRVQQRSDGSFPQNSWVDGRTIGHGLQMDQVAFPILLAQQLGRRNRLTWQKHIKPAADFIVGHGPATEQERWEEESGFSPASIAAQIAALVCAANIAEQNGDRISARLYLHKADEWEQNVERWTVTASGPHDREKYYLRITATGDPEAGSKIEINSGGGTYDERELVDAGFLELVRLGIRSPHDILIGNSLKIVDKLIKIETPNGPAWYRYNHDAYGERPDGGPYDGQNGAGRLWVLLTGERGQYELARGNRELAQKYLDAMMAFANDGLMLPEQVWDKEASPRPELRFGRGTGSATPLAWSMAQFIRLAINLQKGRNTETPKVVVARYIKRQK